MEVLEAKNPETGSVFAKILAPGAALNGAAWSAEVEEIFVPEVVRILVRLHRELEATRQTLLQARRARQAEYDRGQTPGYAEQDSEATTGDWQVAAIPADLQCRRVEITGPINSAKMVINMLTRNSDGYRADTAMLDFEDSMKPSWRNVVAGVKNLIGAVHGTLRFEQPGSPATPGKIYALTPEDMPVIMVRVRGLHLNESNLLIDDAPVSAGLLDFVLSFYHTARALVQQGKTPKYYVPKCEHYLEARWWNRLFTRMEQEVGLPVGTMRATFLIETLPAAFQMEEILYEIREHAAGLNVGRWDKIFSDIKVLRNHPDRVLADRGHINLSSPWMMNYAKRLIKICHARGAFAIGGMAAFTPGKTPERRAEQTDKVVEDKMLEYSMGHDGCWVSHPYFIGPALSAFPRKNQLDVKLEHFDKFPDLLPQPTGPKTLAGLRKNVRVGIAYMNGWNHDIGCVAWDDLMEDLATLEISRTQTWQWLHHGVKLDDGTKVTQALVRRVFTEEFAKIARQVRAEMLGLPASKIERAVSGFARAREDAERIFTNPEFQEFLTLASEPAGA